MVSVIDLDFVTPPVIRLADPGAGSIGQAPHVLRSDGTFCYLDAKAVVLDRYKPAETMIQCLEQADKVLRDAVRGRLDQDLVGEFGAYWADGTVLMDLPLAFEGDAKLQLLKFDRDSEREKVLVSDRASSFLSLHKRNGGKDSEGVLCPVLRVPALTLNRIDPDDSGRFFAETDIFGCYLFLSEAFLDHVWNFEPIYGSRVVPIFKSIGRNLDLIRSVDSVDERAKRLTTSERRQPNGGFFELLVAGAYRRIGAGVAFLPERPGIARTHDMDVTIGDRTFAVECKRLETGQYGERERTRMRELWKSSAMGLSQNEQSAFCDVHFRVPIEKVPDDYVYCHYFVPESPPDQAWAYDETLQWVSIRPAGPHPLADTLLILPDDGERREGVHWGS